MKSKDESVVKLQKTLETAKLSNNREQIVSAYGDLVVYYQGKGDFSNCVKYCTLILPFYANPDQKQELATKNVYIGSCYSLLAENKKSELYYNNALALFLSLDNELGVAEVHVNFGKLYRNMGNFQESLEHLSKALSIYNANLAFLSDDKHLRSRGLYIGAIETSGIIHAQLEQKDASRQYLQQALALIKQYCKPSESVSALVNLGASYSEENTDVALDYYLQADKLLDNDSPFFLKVSVLNNIGGCMEDKEDYENALLYYDKALQFLIDSGQSKYRSMVLKHKGTVQYKQGHYQDASINIELSLQHSLADDAQNEVKDCYLVLSDIYSKMNDFKTALEYRAKYDAVKDKIFHADLSTQLADLQTKYDETVSSLKKLKQENSLISETLKKAMSMSFIGVSESTKKVHELATSAAQHPAARVLIMGESGVGKEIIARLIHYTGLRSRHPFIGINCCSIPASMAESEFFGYVKGAFTGAVNSKAGFLELAHQGTLFLDEIGDMPLELQAKLLRVLETRQLQRLGSNKALNVDFSLISATNRDIHTLIAENRFRADLLYRINTVEINIPPLRERKEDIEPLLQFYLSEFARVMTKPVPTYDKELLQWLYTYDYPGNVRELKNMVEKAVIFLHGNALSIKDFALPERRKSTSTFTPPTSDGFKLAERETQLLLEALKANNGNQTLAARALGISYATFKRKYNKLRTH